MASRKKKAAKIQGQGLIDKVFSWSITDIMNNNLFRDKVKQIPEIFSTLEHYFNSFVDPLLEETRADLRANLTTICHSPHCRIFTVKVHKDFRPSKTLLYKVAFKRRPCEAENEGKKDGGTYEPEFGDLIALTDVKPKRIDDLDRPSRPYTIALIQGGTWQKLILSSKPIKLDKEDKQKGGLYAVFLTNMITNLRIWAFLHPSIKGDHMKIINLVLRRNPLVMEDCSLCLLDGNKCGEMLELRETIGILGLDDSQKDAIVNCIATRECHHQNNVRLIWGPPGTGKTKTIACLLFVLLGMKCRTLTCAPTNIAVIGVAKRLMSLLSVTLPYESYGLGDICLFGNGERMKIDDHEELYDVFLNYRIEILRDCLAPGSGWAAILESMICLLEYPKEQYQRYLLENARQKNDEEEEEKSNENEDTNDDDDEEEETDDEQQEVSGEGESIRSLQDKEVESKDRTLRMRKLITQILKEPIKKLGQSAKNEENRESKSENGVISTFEEFFMMKLNSAGERLMFCMKGLYTHMPTTLLKLEVVENMVKAQAMLRSLKSSLHQAAEINEGLWQVLRLEVLEVLKLLRDAVVVPIFNTDIEIRKFCLENSCLIFCTASSSAKLHVEVKVPIELVIIDEAAQLKECESAIPLQLPGLRHTILVGDEKQLPAMVQSKVCQKADFGRSLFQRLVILGHNKHLLEVQYRMHPSISLFPNRKFYAKQIKDGPNVRKKDHKRRFLKGRMFGFYSFIDVSYGTEGLDDRHSCKNMVEVSVVAEIVSNLFKESKVSKQKVRVGCISPYKAQVFAIEEKLGKKYSTDANDDFSVNIRSVDGFQGGEEDVIIISTVRCNGKGSIGFLSDCQRTNVALTRARHCLWVLGNSTTLLKSNSVWKQLVLDAKSRGCFYNALEDENVARAITSALVELGQFGSLLSTDSILFKESKWKVCFSGELLESMSKIRDRNIRQEVIALVVKLSNGWRQLNNATNQINMDGGASSHLLELCDVKGPLKLIWTVDILREDKLEIQVLKFWDISPTSKILALAEKLNVLFGNYTVDVMSRCLCKRIEGNLILPITWPVETNMRTSLDSSDTSHDLARQLAAVGLWDEAGTSSVRPPRFARSDTMKKKIHPKIKPRKKK